MAVARKGPDAYFTQAVSLEPARSDGGFGSATFRRCWSRCPQSDYPPFQWNYPIVRAICEFRWRRQRQDHPEPATAPPPAVESGGQVASGSSRRRGVQIG